MNTKKIYTRILAAVVCIFFSIVSAESQVSNWTSVGPIAFPSNLTSQINGIGRISQLKSCTDLCSSAACCFRK